MVSSTGLLPQLLSMRDGLLHSCGDDSDIINPIIMTMSGDVTRMCLFALKVMIAISSCGYFCHTLIRRLLPDLAMARDMGSYVRGDDHDILIRLILPCRRPNPLSAPGQVTATIASNSARYANALLVMARSSLLPSPRPAKARAMLSCAHDDEHGIITRSCASGKDWR